jgi:hypothetical protein
MIIFDSARKSQTCSKKNQGTFYKTPAIVGYNDKEIKLAQKQKIMAQIGSF